MKKGKTQTILRKYFFIIGVFLFLGYMILSFFVNKNVFRKVDYDFMIYLQNAIPRGFDLPFSLLTLTGSSEWTALVIGSVGLYFMIKRSKLPLGLMLFGVVFIIEILGKLFIFHPIPPPLLNRNVLPISLPSSYFVHTNFSYPSGHMSRSTYVSVILVVLILFSNFSLRTKKKYTVIGVLYVAGMCLSRVYLGEHWLTDVFGGILLGGGLSFLTFVLW